MKRVGLILVSLLIPFVLLMAAVRIAFSPFFLDLEYNAPKLPPDDYGFTTAERLYWGKLSLQYLVDDSEITFLEDQRLPNWEPLYNERELSHMLDVKLVLQKTTLVWGVICVALAAVGLWSWRGRWLQDYWRAVATGGWITLGVIVAILFGVAVGFNQLFGAFHTLFFTSGTWVFAYSDTLIRLFPIKLWQDAFIFVGLITAGLALAAALGLPALRRRKNQSRKCA